MLPSEEGFPRPFGSYLLLASFGRGGMGEVFLAKSGGLEGIERICVLKMMRRDRADEENARRFLDEARLTVQLHHANICNVFDVGQVGEHTYLAMDFIPGVHLGVVRDRARAMGIAVEEKVSLYIASEVLEALDYAHRLTHPMTGEALNLVHRDISPQNVMVSFEGEVTLIDFGMAESALKTEETADNQVIGKVAYMAPEHARGDDVSPACDQFSAAQVLYELLARDRFYGDKRLHEIWQIVGFGGFQPRKWVALSEVVKPLLARALDADPKARFASCADFRDAVDEIRPRGGRKETRALMRYLFADRIEETRALLARFADVQAPVVSYDSQPFPPSEGGAAGLDEASTARERIEPASVAEPTEGFDLAPGDTERVDREALATPLPASAQDHRRRGRRLAFGALALLAVAAVGWAVTLDEGQLAAAPALPMPKTSPPAVDIEASSPPPTREDGARPGEAVPAANDPDDSDVHGEAGGADDDGEDGEQDATPSIVDATATPAGVPPPTGRARRRSRRRTTRSTPTVAAPSEGATGTTATPLTSGTPEIRIVKKPEEERPAQRVVERKSPRLRAEILLDRLRQCSASCAKPLVETTRDKGGARALKRGDLVLLEHCAGQCD